MIELFTFLSFLISCLVGWTVIPRILVISEKKNLFDIPNDRTSHEGVVPRLGGVSFFPSMLFSLSLILALRYMFGYYVHDSLVSSLLIEFLFLICGTVLLFFVGIKDDLIGVLYGKKFLIQFAAAAFLPISGIYINNLYGLFGVYELPAWIGMPFTVVLAIFVTNAINLIDGIDGLASGLSGVALLTFGFLFYQENLYSYSMLAFSTLGVLTPFFYFNVFGKQKKKNKIFMGDTGSLTLGYILAFLSIKYSMDNSVHSLTNGSIMIAFSALFIPIFDAIRVVLVRAEHRKPLFLPDRNHIHHKCLDLGMSHRQAMIFIVLCGCGFVVLNIVMLQFININVLFLFDVLLGVGINMVLNQVKKRMDRF